MAFLPGWGERGDSFRRQADDRQAIEVNWALSYEVHSMFTAWSSRYEPYRMRSLVLLQALSKPKGLNAEGTSETTGILWRNEWIWWIDTPNRHIAMWPILWGDELGEPNTRWSSSEEFLLVSQKTDLMNYSHVSISWCWGGEHFPTDRTLVFWLSLRWRRHRFTQPGDLWTEKPNKIQTFGMINDLS